MGSIWKSWDSNFLKGEGWGAKSVWVCPRFEEFSNGIHLHLIDKNLPQGWFYSQGNLGNAITVVIVINTSKYSGYENGNRGYIANFQCLTHWQKKANMTHQKENPPIGHKHHFWTICQSILFKELANWPTTCVLLVIWNPGMSPHYTSSSSGWSFLCNSGRAGEQQGFMGIPNPMQFTCYVAIKVIILVTYCCITGYLKT